MTTPLFPLIVSAALGQQGEVILPEIAPVEFRSIYTESRRSAGFIGSRAEPMCLDFVEDLILCFRIKREGRLEWLSREAARGIEGGEQGVLNKVTFGEAEKNPLVEKGGAGEGAWWQVEAPKGFQDLVFLRPDWLKRVGENPVVAIPAHGVVVAWNAGDADNDQILAVGVRRIFEQAEFPLSPKILRYSGGAWSVWGEALAPQEKADETGTR